MTVYIIRAGDTDKVKIGWAAEDAAVRLRNLQVGCWEQLRIIRIIDGYRLVESWMHRRFAASRIRSEWFTFDPEMLTVEPPDPIRATRPTKGGLAGWLAANGLSMSDFAQQIGVTPSAVSRWCSGQIFPSNKMRRIFKATDGGVRPDDFIPATDKAA